MRPTFPLAAAALLAFAATGCAPSLRIRGVEPARVNLGPARQLSLVQTEGRASTRQLLAHELTLQALRGGHFAVVDRTFEGMVVRVTPSDVHVWGAPGPQVPTEALLRIDVHDWSSVIEEHQREKKDEKGNVTVTTDRSVSGRVTLGVTLINGSGEALLAEQDYSATSSAGDENEALRGAARAAIAQLLGDITPRVTEQTIRLDDRDKAQRPMLELAVKGNLPAATEALSAYVAQNPGSAVAQYNLAALYDAAGRFREALDYYTRALQSEERKGFWAASRADCVQRLANQDAMAR